ncbi:hypothetical protein H0N95_01160 [Candidatus Micrarchaeota archaeon]|nr:hypothetical protein [Candidatus Micrarchaeota archaeon]
MKRGLFSLDAIMAILLLLFLFMWGQSLVSSNFDRANSFGVNYEAKAEAIRAGSIMNTFLSTKPGVNDYAPLTASNAKAFKDNSAMFTIEKNLASALKVTMQNRFSVVTATYPTATKALFSAGKITASP